MRLAVHKWILRSFGVLSFAVVALAVTLTVGWMASTVIKSFSASSGRGQTERSTFATITAQQSSEIYLKDSRAFIFSRTESNQNLKLHDSVLVGPKSEATLMLSDEFGGGEIRLAANTIITLSRAGRRNEIPRIHIKQGEIKIIAAPLKRKTKQEALQVAQAESVAVNSSAAVTNTPSKPEAAELPGVLITGGQQAVVFDESLTNTELSIGETTKNLEVKVVAAPNKAEITESRDEDLAQQDTSEEASPAPSYTISTISLEAIEEISLESQTLSEAVAQIDQAALDTAITDVTREPAEVLEEEAAVEDVEVFEDIEAVEEAAPTNFAEKEEVSDDEVRANAAPIQEAKTQEIEISPPGPPPAGTRSLLFDTPEEYAEKLRQYELQLKLARRSYQGDGVEAQSTDLDVGIKGEKQLNEKWSIAVHAEVSAVNLQKPRNGEAPRPWALSGEIKYHIFENRRRRLVLVGGYSYQSTLGGNGTPTYTHVYAPLFGFDWAFDLGMGPSTNALLAPRFVLLSKDIYTFTIPLTLYWDERWGLILHYSKLSLSSTTSNSQFQTMGAGVSWKF